MWTFTVDASVDLRTNSIGIGILIQVSESSKASRRGQVVDSLSERHVYARGILPEALAILRALELAAERGYRCIRVRSDDNPLRRSLKKAFRGERDPGAGMRTQIHELAQNFERVEFSWVPRRKNQRAHRLAREGRWLGIDRPVAAARSNEPDYYFGVEFSPESVEADEEIPF